MRWELKKINGDEVSSKTKVNFIVLSDHIELQNLYPFYPKLSGTVVLQFLSALSYTCDLPIQLIDASDLNVPFLSHFGQTYYEHVLMGPKEMLPV